MSIITLESVSKIYNQNNNEIKALDNINLSVESGQFIAIIGTSGSGKSTLLNMMGGIDCPTSGRIVVDNEEITKYGTNKLALFRRRKVGIVYQFYNLVTVLNVEENITLPARLDKQKVDKERLEELLTLFNLQDRRKHFPAELSGGQQQRVAIARAVYHSPAIILADEPTGNLDVDNTGEVMRILENEHKKGRAIVMITHDVEVAKRAGAVYRLEDGELHEDN